MVWPKSGCSTSRPTTTTSIASAKVLAGISGRRPDSPNSQAIRTTKAGLRNSDGCTLTPRITSQRRAPLISAPKNGVTATSTRLTTKTTSASWRISRGDRNEVAIRTATAGMRNSTWRLTKWNGSSPMRAATGGLAARHSTMPPSISAPSAASVSRSTVRHHSLSSVGCAREAMASPKCRLVRRMVSGD